MNDLNMMGFHKFADNAALMELCTEVDDQTGGRIR